MRHARIVGATGAGVVSLLVARALQKRIAGSYEFRGKSVLITGGSRGLGLILARMLVDEGARLTIVARDRADLNRAVQELKQRGGIVTGHEADVGRQEEAEAVVEGAIDQYGRLDVLINNAGIIQGGPVEHMSLQDYEDAMAIHFWAPLYMTLAAAPYMKRQGEGRIVNIASVGGLVAVPHLLPYVASKFALVGLSDGMRAELAKDGIKVTTVCPGLMRTGSHFNALIKGQHRKEFALYAIINALPLASMDARKAARQILEACRRGDPHLTTTVQARLLAFVDALFPDLLGNVMAVVGGLLPGPIGPEGDYPRTGWESQSRLAPSLLTRLADKATFRNNEAGEHPAQL